MLRISAFHFRTYQARGLAQVVRDQPLPNYWKHVVGVLQREPGSEVSISPHSRILSLHSLGLRSRIVPPSSKPLNQCFLARRISPCQPHHPAGFCLLTAFWVCAFFHPDRMIYSNDLFWRSLLSPSSPPRRSIRSFHTTADDPGSYLSSLQQGCDIASTVASSPEPLRPCGHPESPPPAGTQCSLSIPGYADRHLPVLHLPTSFMI